MTTAADLAYHKIRKMVLNGDLAPGQRISQLRIARELRCSTAPVVEALRRLESECLLVKEPRKMARVRVLMAEEVKGLFLVRQAMEAAATRLCAELIEGAELDELQALNERFESAASQRDNDASDQLDIEIHRTIARFARCPLLEQELDRLMLIARTVPGQTLPDDWDRYQKSHRWIVEAIAGHDPDLAEYLMKKHIQVGYQQMLQRAHLK